MGQNLLVADWGIGDRSYLDLARKLEIKRLPSIVLTDVHKPDKKGFLVVIDNDVLVDNLDIVIDILPNIVNLVLLGKQSDVLEELKDAIKNKQPSKVKSLLKPISSALNSIDASI